MRVLRALAVVAALSTAVAGAQAAVRPGTIVTVAGIGIEGSVGDGGPAQLARLTHPRGLAALPDGGFLIVDAFAGSVRRVSPDGTITIVAGRGQSTDDGQPATAVRFRLPHSVAPMSDGGFLVADSANNRVRRVAPDGIITTVAGNGLPRFAGDGGPATAARIDTPRAISATADGGFLIADSNNQRIRRVWPNGVITTVAGNGQAGYSGDGGPGINARVNNPYGVAATPDGGFLIADTGNSRIRRVAPDGTISTVAGTGAVGFSGDGGQASAAQIAGPVNVAPTNDGGFLIADAGNHRIRRVSPDGVISTVAGTGVPGFGGDKGLAVTAQLNSPKAAVELADGSLLIADSDNARIRFVGNAARPYFRRLSVSVLPRKVTRKSGRVLVLRATTTAWAKVHLEVYEGKRRLFALKPITARPGTPVALPLGTKGAFGVFTLRIKAVGVDGQKASASTQLRITR